MRNKKKTSRYAAVAESAEHTQRRIPIPFLSRYQKPVLHEQQLLKNKDKGIGNQAREHVWRDRVSDLDTVNQQHKSHACIWS